MKTTVFHSYGAMMEIVTACTFLVLISLGYCEDGSDVLPPLLNVSKSYVDVPYRSPLIIECRGKEEVTWHYKSVETWKLRNSDKQPEVYSQQGNVSLLHLPPSYVFTGLYTCSYKNTTLQRNASVYVFMNDPNHLFVPQTEFNTTLSIPMNAESHLYVPCLPTNSKVNVTLWEYTTTSHRLLIKELITFDPTKGFLSLEPLPRNLTCRGTWSNFEESTSIFSIEVSIDSIPKPFIGRDLLHWKVGDSNYLKCSVAVRINTNFHLKWIYPQADVSDLTAYEGQQQVVRRRHYQILFRILNVASVSASHEGFYTCVLQENDRTNSTERSKDEVYISVYRKKIERVSFERFNTSSSITANHGSSATFSVSVTNYDLKDIEIHWEKDGLLIQETTKYQLDVYSSPVSLTIHNLQRTDAGNYRLTGRRVYPYTFSNISFLLTVTSIPSVELLLMSPDRFYKAYKVYDLQCIVESYPVSDITWTWKNCTSWNDCSEEMVRKQQSNDTKRKLENSMIEKKSVLTVNATISGNYSCIANNSVGENNRSASFIVTDIYDGLPIRLWSDDPTPNKIVDVNVYCQVTNFAYENITWYFIQVPGNYTMVSLHDQPEYKISDESKGFSERSVLTFKAAKNRSGLYGCNYIDKLNDTPKYNFTGVYINIEPELPAVSPLTPIGDSENSPQLSTATVTIISVVVVAALLVIVTIVAVAVKVRRKNSKFNPYNFQSGDPNLINPNLPLEDQVELLPYDPRWEFPKDRLKLGRVIGHGAFGRVVKAEAIGLESHVPYTTVAVKMLKDKNDEGQYKSLMAELKIMIHLGRHVNILNLMGAVTKNVYKGELMVMVEYCCHGNLRSYLLKHREKFINQIDPETGKVNKDILFENIPESTEEENKHGFYYSKPIALAISNPAYNYSSTAQLIKSIGSNGTEVTGGSNISGTTGGETSIDTIGGSESGYSSTGDAVNFAFGGKEAVRYSGILTTSDLLCYCFQCAQGMSYLASRKLLHRDLAARNILLAEGNVIKISDFGLSKDVYKYSKYVKKADGPLPVKWMAIESIRDRVFTTKSDVWSFGVLMWEIFTLGGNPYPGFEMNEGFFKRLQEGYRLEKPEYAPVDVYEIMLDCWHSSPKERPDFSDLGEQIGQMLQASVKEHYIELNGPYAELNTNLRSLEDYLNMSTANYLDMNTSVQETNVDNANSPVPDYMTFTDLGQKQEKPTYYNIPPTIKEQDTEFSLDLENEDAGKDSSVQIDSEETGNEVNSSKKTPHKETLLGDSSSSTDVKSEVRESSTDKIGTKNPDYLNMT